MNGDFHYYGTGTAAIAAGLSVQDAQMVANAAEFVDYFVGDYYWSNWQIVPDNSTSPEYLFTITYPQLSAQEIGSILDYYPDYWLAFHFPPGNLKTDPGQFSGEMAKLQERYRAKFVLREVNSKVENGAQLCRPYSQFIIDMIYDTIQTCQAIKTDPQWKEILKKKIAPNERYISDKISKDQMALIFLGMRMHILADSWAHQDFTGFDDTSINYCGGEPVLADVNQTGKMEEAIFDINLPDGDCTFGPATGRGHGNMGHYPDYGWLTIEYPTAWNTTTNRIRRDNPGQFKEAWKELAAVITMAIFPDKSSEVAMPADVEGAIIKLFKLNPDGVSAPIECEKNWAETAGKSVVGKHWKNLRKSPELGVTHGLAKTHFGNIWIQDGSILHMYELAATLHFSWCESWTKEHPAYGWKPKRLEN